MEELAAQATIKMDMCDFAGAFESIAQIATLANTYLATQEFWNLVKIDDVSEEVASAKLDLLEELLLVNFEILRILSLLLLPYCPETASKMLLLVL